MTIENSKQIKKQVGFFFLFTFATSWSIFGIGKLLDTELIMIVGIWAPTIISLVLTGVFFGKKGLIKFLSRFRRINIKWYWWLALLLLPATVHFIGRSAWQLYYDGEITPTIMPLNWWLRSIIPSFLIAGFGEELGWRGFALPRLQKIYSPTKATLILAFFHVIWHAPTYWLGQGIHNVPAWYMILFGIGWTFVFVWLYNKSGGSLIFAVGFHAISNASLSIVQFMPNESEVPISPELITMANLEPKLAGPYLSVIALYLVLAFVVWRFGKFDQVNTDLP